MFKKYKVLKWTALFLISLLVIIVSFGIWFKSLLPDRDLNLETTLAEDLPYLSEEIIPVKGKILAIVTSTDVMGTTDKSTGYELTELARAYYVFKANGFEVDIASPKGGTPPVVIDKEDMGAYDYAFLNDANAQAKANNTIPLANVVADEYEAVFFAGGKGAMFDFPNNRAIQTLVRDYFQTNKVIGAVCHGPAALINVTLDNGQSLVENKKVSAFTNKEELLLIKDAKSIFPFLLQDKLVEQGASFNEGSMYLEKVSRDKNLVTGQNPWSTWKLAEEMIAQMGLTPKKRKMTDEENAVKVLSAYRLDGKAAAKDTIIEILLEDNSPINRVLIAKHGIIAVMKVELGSFYDLISLVSFTKRYESKRAKKFN